LSLIGAMSLPLRSSPLLRQTLRNPLRQYHSPNHRPAPSYTPLQDKILSTALTHVPTTGFTHETLSIGAKEAGYLEITHNLFPRGPFSLVEYHLVTQREKLNTIPLEESGVGKTIRKLCVERLKGNKEIIGRWQEVGAPFACVEWELTWGRLWR
jgi:ubiquinone biosynthesis protein COQ9